jgi:hypothetical protein
MTADRFAALVKAAGMTPRIRSDSWIPIPGDAVTLLER